MNRSDSTHTPHKFAHQWVSDAYSTVSAMLTMSRDFSSPPDVRNVSDDRIHPQIQRARHADFETTADGDVVIVQPSFDDDTSKTPLRSHLKQRNDWQARSPQQEDEKHRDTEMRNPSSPPQALQGAPNPRHTRNLSGHFFDATTLGRSGSSDSSDMYKEDDYQEQGRKHRRMTSNGLSNPNVAHRRINSIGNSAAVNRRHFHQREHSAGLDILSAAVDASKDELAQAAGDQRSMNQGDWEPPASLQQPHLTYSYPPPPHHLSHMQPPHSRRYTGPPPPGSYIAGPGHGPYPPPQHVGYSGYPPPSYYPSAFPARHGYPAQQYPSQHSMYPTHKGMMYPPENRSRPPESSAGGVVLSKEPEWGNREPAGTHQGSQTFVTTMAVGGNKVIRPSIPQRNATTTDTDNVPSHISHHRKMSSFSSLGLGTIFGSSIMSPVAEQESHPLKKASTTAHHRSTSSTVSFMNALDVVGMDGTADETFLRNLQESSNSDYRSDTPSVLPSSSKNSSATEAPSESQSCKLASGGTSKRVRRKCTVTGCANRVVQGGLCISHGAKRKTCSHPGCNKNVKKAGLCSTHGPARKRCENHGCQKVAVQGGKCIAHGAKKKLCSFENCNKQAILSGMCKKHHDLTKEGSDGSESDESKDKKAYKPSHTRGLSIFHDISADAVQSLLNAETVVAPTPPEPPRRAADDMW
jgi:hypothetical protein